MGQVLCEIRILDGTDTIIWYAVWNNTSDKVVDEHPLFDTRKAGEMYMVLPVQFQIELSREFGNLTEQDIYDFAVKKLREGD